MPSSVHGLTPFAGERSPITTRRICVDLTRDGRDTRLRGAAELLVRPRRAFKGVGMSKSQRCVVIGASAGGVEALREVVARLPGGLPAPVFVVLHIPPYVASSLPRILNRCGPLKAVH